MPPPNWNPEDGLEVQAKDVLEAAENNHPFRLIDCREEDEHALCHLAGCELIPLGHLPALAPARLPDQDETIVIYCHHGMRSAHAAAYLRAKGYRHCYSLAGGTDLWSQEIDPSLPRY